MPSPATVAGQRNRGIPANDGDWPLITVRRGTQRARHAGDDPSLVRRRIEAGYGLVTPYDVLVILTAGDRSYPLDATANGTFVAR
jgi:hypothetical protein